MIGSDVFYQTLGRELRQEVPVDRLYIFDGRKCSQGLQQLIAENEPGKLAIGNDTYGGQYLTVDSIQDTIDGAREEGAIVRLKVSPGRYQQ